MGATNQVSNFGQQGKDVHVIFVSEIEEKWEQDDAIASEIMKRAGVADPSKFVLEALNHKGGDPVAEFQADDTVNFDDKDRKFFRVTPGGGGRS